MKMKKKDAFLERLRAICLALPEAEETVSWGHPTFRAARKTFAVFETYKGIPSLAFHAGSAAQPALLKDPRFYKTPYIGHKGWVSLDTRQPVDWDEVLLGVLSRTTRTLYRRNLNRYGSDCAVQFASTEVSRFVEESYRKVVPARLRCAQTP